MFYITNFVCYFENDPRIDIFCLLHFECKNLYFLISGRLLLIVRDYKAKSREFTSEIVFELWYMRKTCHTLDEFHSDTQRQAPNINFSDPQYL